MKYDYDILSIGMGPAGMAVSAMGDGMGFKVAAVEKRKIGGECMNVGCIPSKALLKIAATRHSVTLNERMGLDPAPKSAVRNPFKRVRDHVEYIKENKTKGMFERVDLVLAQGAASFVDPHTVRVGDRSISAKKIFINVGTRPAVPPIPGVDEVDYLTNENMFDMDAVPDSITIIGGGAIGSEMAQAFSRLGAKITIVHMDPHLIPLGDEESGSILEKVFKNEGIDVYNNRKIQKLEQTADGIALTTDRDETFVSEKLLVAAGRRPDFGALDLDKAGVKTDPRGYIKVNKYLQTSQPNIYAPGDCNGHYLLSHAAMHQGMIALMNSIMPGPMKKKFKNYVVPWTVFTDPQVSWAGKTKSQLKKEGVTFDVIKVRYEDYGAAIAEGFTVGHVKVLTNKKGRIFGAGVVGEGSGEMINQWGQAIQFKLNLNDVMMLQHSFPSMSFLNKRIGETWMMKKMQSADFMKTMMKGMFNLT